MGRRRFKAAYRDSASSPPGFDIGRRMSRCPGIRKMPPASHQVSATPLKLLIHQINHHLRVERDSEMCVARDLYELWGRSPYTRMFVARTSH